MGRSVRDLLSNAGGKKKHCKADVLTANVRWSTPVCLVRSTARSRSSVTHTGNLSVKCRQMLDLPVEDVTVEDDKRRRLARQRDRRAKGGLPRNQFWKEDVSRRNISIDSVSVNDESCSYDLT